MKLLVVNNHSKHLTSLLQNLPRVAVVDFLDLKNIDWRKYDAVILSGGSSLNVMGHDSVYAAELAMIRTCGLPILGICLGFELICHAFGERLELSRTADGVRGVHAIKIMGADSLFNSMLPTLPVFEAHRWIVPSTNYLIPLAVSAHGIEAVRHPQFPIFGVQFHPEVAVSGSHAVQMLENFLDVAVEYNRLRE